MHMPEYVIETRRYNELITYVDVNAALITPEQYVNNFHDQVNPFAMTQWVGVASQFENKPYTIIMLVCDVRDPAIEPMLHEYLIPDVAQIIMSYIPHKSDPQYLFGYDYEELRAYLRPRLEARMGVSRQVLINHIEAGWPLQDPICCIL
jgi:hypothetical protein